jgi:hypothetical protein
MFSRSVNVHVYVWFSNFMAILLQLLVTFFVYSLFD